MFRVLCWWWKISKNMAYDGEERELEIGMVMSMVVKVVTWWKVTNQRR